MRATRSRIQSHLRLATIVVLMLRVPRRADAQADQGGIEGVVFDSVHARPLARVRVVAVDAAAPADVMRQRVSYASDIAWKVSGFRVVGTGYNATVVDARGGSLRPCPANIVIDGSENRSINEANAFDIGAMEFYRAGEPAPMLYDRGCGAIVIWTER